MLLLHILFWILVFFGVLSFLSFVSGRFYQRTGAPSSVHFCETEDGWRIALSRYSNEEVSSKSPVVVLCPGLGLSAEIFNFAEEPLPRVLAAFGFDPWVLDLRGRGLSSGPRLFNSRRRRWTFDDYADFDVPAALETVLKRTGARKVHWVGFGLGLNVLIAALAKKVKAEQLASVTGIAASFFFRRAGTNLTYPASSFALARWLWRPGVLRLLAPVLGRLAPSLSKHAQNLDNVDGTRYRRALLSSAAPVSSPEARQLAAWMQKDRFDTSDSKLDYRSVLAELAVPLLLVHGVRDPLAPPEDIDASLDAAMVSTEKRKLLASRLDGMSCNYGHLDLIVGRMAHKEIFPAIASWLQEREAAGDDADLSEA